MFHMIEDLLAQSEGKTLEFKENCRSLQGIVKTVISFANTAGGTILIGVRDKTKEIVGVENVLEEEERLANAIADSVSPLLIPDIFIQSAKGKEFLIIQVPHGIGPFYLKSEGPLEGVYVRFGSTNRQADEEMLDSLRLLSKKLSYDELPHSKGVLDFSLIKQVFQKIKKSPTQNHCESLGILTKSMGQVHPSNGGVILFGSNRVELFPDAIIRCARFAGQTKEKILDQIELTESSILAIEHVIAFIERNVRKEGKIGRIYREDILEYPPLALREAIINAFLHADYAMKGCHIQVAIFDHRIEITNPGGLPFGLTLEKAISGNSRLRNRVIGRVFRELKLIEQWGSGLLRIIEACAKMGLRPPHIEEMNNQFRITLYSTQVEETQLELWERILLNHLKELGPVTGKEAAKIWKVAHRTARTRLKALQKAGIIVRIGTSKNDPNATYIAARKMEH